MVASAGQQSGNELKHRHRVDNDFRDTVQNRKQHQWRSSAESYAGRNFMNFIDILNFTLMLPNYQAPGSMAAYMDVATYGDEKAVVVRVLRYFRRGYIQREGGPS
jgi:hypothetical protein